MPQGSLKFRQLPGRIGQDDAQRQFARYAAFYQGDAVVKQPLFARS